MESRSLGPASSLPAFGTDRIIDRLDALSREERDELPFGVIGFDRTTEVRVYNRYEVEAAGLGAAKVVGHPFFDVVAPCMNNDLVAQRFQDAWASNDELDATIDYVLTLRMRPVRVALRLLVHPDVELAYVLVQRMVRT